MEKISKTVVGVVFDRINMQGLKYFLEYNKSFKQTGNG